MQHLPTSRVEEFFSCKFVYYKFVCYSNISIQFSSLFSSYVHGRFACHNTNAFYLRTKAFIPEIPSLFIQRPIVARHQKAALYHPFIEAVALTIVDIPITFFTSLLFGTIIYEAVRLQQSAGQFL
jgi:ABC-2 type transporter